MHIYIYVCVLSQKMYLPVYIIYYLYHLSGILFDNIYVYIYIYIYIYVCIMPIVMYSSFFFFSFFFYLPFFFFFFFHFLLLQCLVPYYLFLSKCLKWKNLILFIDFFLFPVRFSFLMLLLHLSLETTYRFIHQRLFCPILIAYKY